MTEEQAIKVKQIIRATVELSGGKPKAKILNDAVKDIIEALDQ